MFHEMHKKDRMLSLEEAKELLENEDADSKSVIVFGTAQKAPEAYDMVLKKLVEKFVPPFA